MQDQDLRLHDLPRTPRRLDAPVGPERVEHPPLDKRCADHTSRSFDDHDEAGDHGHEASDRDDETQHDQ